MFCATMKKLLSLHDIKNKMDTIQNEKQEILDKRYLRMSKIWAENSYCQRRKVIN